MGENMTRSDLARLDAQLDSLHLSHVKSHYQAFATTAAQNQLSHLEYLAELIEAEAAVRENRAIERRIKKARLPVLKTMEDFEWNWPKRSIGPRSRTCSVSPFARGPWREQDLDQRSRM
jgi:DNA replication protein DnaC